MQAAAVIAGVTGQVSVERNGQKLSAAKGMELFVTDVVHTGKDGKASMRFRDGTELDLHGDTHAKLEDFVFDESGTPPPTFAVEVMQGLARTATGKVVEMNPEGFAINTPLGTAGIRGTTIWTHVTASQVVFTVTEMGKGHIVVVTSPDGQTLLIKVPDSGVILTGKGEATIDMEHLTPEKLDKFIKEVVGQALENDAHLSATSHGVFVIADAEFLASIGAMSITDELGFVPAEDNSLMIDALALLGFSMDEHFIPDYHIPGSDDSNTPSGPPYYFYGTPGPDNITGTGDMDIVYAYTGNDTISTGKGNDTIYSGAGRDSISAGYGSSDQIFKQASLGNSVIYGDVEILSESTGDADYIEIGASSANRHRGFVSGDAYTLTAEAMPGNDTIKIVGSLVGGGYVVGDANLMGNAKVGIDADTGDTAYGQDQIDVETLAGGSIFGDGVFLTGVLSGSAAGAFSDTITVKSMSGGEIVGDFQNIEAGADASALGAGAFADSITVGKLTGGSITGDAINVFADNFTLGNDTIRVSGNMSNATIYGDTDSGDTANLTFGDDNIRIVGNMGSNAVVYGDAYALKGVGATLGNDTINVGGSMGSNATIFGDAWGLWADTSLGNDKITVGGMKNNASISGDVYQVDVANARLGNDVITVKGNVNSSSIYGDAYIQTGANISYGNDTINVNGTLKGGDVYGDAHVITGSAAPGNDSITINKADFYSNVYGDAWNIESALTSAQKGGNDSIKVTELNGLLFGDAKLLSGVVSATSVPSRGAFSDVIEVGTVTDHIPSGENGRSTIYGDFGEVLTAAQINLSGPAHDNAFCDSITVGVHKGYIYGDAGNLDIAWSIGGHDTIQVSNLEYGTIAGDFGFLGSGASGSIFGNDVITVTGSTGGSIYGDCFVSSGVEAQAVSGLVYGNDSITLTGSMNGLYVYADAFCISPASQLGHDTINAEHATFTSMGTIAGDGCNLYGADLSNANKLGRDLITIGTISSEFMSVYGDAVFLAGGTISINQWEAFNDTINVTTLNDGGVFGDFGSIAAPTTISMDGWRLFNDSIHVDTMWGGTVSGDFDEWSNNIVFNHFSGCEKFNDTIEIGTLRDGQVFGDARALTHDLPTASFGGGEAMSDIITITDMYGGFVYGDAQDVTRGDINGGFTLGGNTITVTGTMYGGTIYGTSENFTFAPSSPSTPFKLKGNIIEIGTLDGGTIYGTYKSLIGNGNGYYDSGFTTQSVYITNMLSGTVHMCEGNDYVGINGHLGGGTIDFGGGGTDRLLFGTGFTYTPGSVITLSGTTGVALQIDLSSTSLVETNASRTADYIYLSDSSDTNPSVITLRVAEGNALDPGAITIV